MAGSSCEVTLDVFLFFSHPACCPQRLLTLGLSPHGAASARPRPRLSSCHPLSPTTAVASSLSPISAARPAGAFPAARVIVEAPFGVKRAEKEE